MKIVATSNYDDETQSDVLICENVTEVMGIHIRNLLQDHEGDSSDNYYRCLPDDYKLYEWRP